MTLVFPNSSDIEYARKLALRKCLKLEILGLKRHGRSAYSIIKQETGLKGSKTRVYVAFTEQLNRERPGMDLTAQLGGLR